MIFKHGAPFGWECITSSIFSTLVNPVPSHFWIFWCTFELIALHIRQRLDPSFLVSSCRCGTFPHVISVICCTPNTPGGRWFYLFTFLWHLHPHSYTRSRYPSWYYLSKSIWAIKAVSGLLSEKHFHHEILPMMPWIPLLHVALYNHKLLMQDPMPFTQLLLLPYFPPPQI